MVESLQSPPLFHPAGFIVAPVAPNTVKPGPLEGVLVAVIR